MRLAILDADILRESLQSKYHSYGRMFEALFERQQLDWEMDTFRVIEGDYPPDMNRYDAYLITGSQYDAFSDDPWVRRLREYVQALFQTGKPMVGICFGHQLLAHALGGEAGRASGGWGLGVMTYPLLTRPPFVDDAEPVSLIISHRDQVTRLPPDAERLLSNEFCPNAAFYIPGRVLAIQGHPEFSVDYAQALLQYRKHELNPDHLARVIQSYSVPHQGERVGHWMRRFLEQAVA
ncbi:hypothetical protein OOT55_09845 [Marinimicrobium sp. C6131]|uniref:glutamine amidotransferase-related protein n=1 Tax=Marinimicrobium sp. C6131 TaxID=3022676 RepID=UPI00223D10AF|nr:hypothetical protein [Marinimicrobium sp. C6131]UZJ42954.1 hypothetical protein OOT55_09845 [Marinimicrobium sp. C6131]